MKITSYFHFPGTQIYAFFINDVGFAGKIVGLFFLSLQNDVIARELGRYFGKIIYYWIFYANWV